jgi:hypothetical protein
LKLTTEQPIGPTCSNTELIVLSFPAASIPWSTTSSAYRASAYSTFCRSFSRSRRPTISASASSLVIPFVAAGSNFRRSTFVWGG